MPNVSKIYIDSAIYGSPESTFRGLVFNRTSASRKESGDRHRHDYDKSGAQWRSRVGSATGLGLLLPFGAVTAVLTKKAGQKWAQPYSRVKGSELRKNDGRGPVLFLRAFEDDKVRVGFHRLEPICQEVVSHIGPLLAIGQPGEAVPLAGAARDYFGEEEWKRAVTEEVKKAQLVFLMAGTTHGLRWELDEILRQASFSKTLLVLPPDQTEKRWNDFQFVAPALLQTMLPSFEVIHDGRVLLISHEHPPLVIASRELSYTAYQTALQFAVTQALINRRAIPPPAFDLYGQPDRVLPTEQVGNANKRRYNRRLLVSSALVLAIPIGIWTYGLTVGFDPYGGRIGLLRKAISPPAEPRVPTASVLSAVSDNPYSSSESYRLSYATGFVAGSQRGRNASHLLKIDPVLHTEQFFVENHIPAGIEEAKRKENERASSQRREAFTLEAAFSEGYKKGFLKSVFRR